MNRYMHEKVGEIPTKEGETLAVVRGWSGIFAQLLVKQSQQAEIMKWTPSDMAKRFTTYAHAQRWYEDMDKTPVTYSLGLTGTQLAGMAWFSKSANPAASGAKRTFGIRLYEGFSGQGLSKPFAEIVHADMDKSYGSEVWLETDVDNYPARKLYENLGYIAVGEAEGQRIVMARPRVDLI